MVLRRRGGVKAVDDGKAQRSALSKCRMVGGGGM